MEIINARRVTDINLTIFDVAGNQVLQRTLSGDFRYPIDLKQLQSGVYYVEVTGQGETIRKPLVVQ